MSPERRPHTHPRHPATHDKGYFASGSTAFLDTEERFIRLHRCEFPNEKDFEEWKKDVEADYRSRKKFR